MKRTRRRIKLWRAKAIPPAATSEQCAKVRSFFADTLKFEGIPTIRRGGNDQISYPREIATNTESGLFAS